MRAISPDIGSPERVVAEEQHEYMPLPVAFVAHPDGLRTLVTRWRLTPDERRRIAGGEDFYVGQLNFGGPMTPLVVSVGPIVFDESPAAP